ncbi:DUF4878 domain-containing protein [Mycolicibacterium moriokaense]|jgi:hypothetical protein|uniref:DUF4878 domain-containing protein n=1 Tax=Mycolicibacterium moriokaense TaxID=39691 RepID=A0AAD1HGQ3_9MYCO|nr:DUF4878 domain-containing protein [Mycolicibacterium moriokaense]MCV7042322.1 DUF4878 domain-containing protein [Mycolicibacterium moriokaense]ORB17637.1 DUF4878 domain-containing protein [Mycolicibacterium moriokaense]BBX05095.1 hypothetical protein MMOR_60310 [Mycolicibacterium moriokaense]
MSNPQGPDQSDEVTDEATDAADGQPAAESAPANADEAETTAAAAHDADPVTEVISTEAPEEPERRYTAPSAFDAGTTTRIDTPFDPVTEVMDTAPASAVKPVAPQVIPPRGDTPKPPKPKSRSWGWVIAILLVIAALVAVAILGTILLTRDTEPKVSQEDLVRQTIESYDAAIAKGDLATLRTITCGSVRDNYVSYNDRVWSDTHARIAAAKRYPVIASVDQIVVNGDHAEANVTTFMAYAPQTRSTRSLDLEFRDDQWKICQAPTS